MRKKNKKEVSIGQKRFRLGLKIYAGVLAFAILVVCIIVWNKLSKYQDRYDKAKAEGNPDIYAEEFIQGLSYDSLLDYIKEYGLNVKGEFDYEAEHAEYFSEMIKKNEASVVRSEKFKSALPATGASPLSSGNIVPAGITGKIKGLMNALAVREETAARR